MKLKWSVTIGAVAVVLAMSATALAQESLADKARAARKDKPAPTAGKKVFTNDSMGLPEQPQAAAPAASAAATAPEQAAAAAPVQSSETVNYDEQGNVTNPSALAPAAPAKPATQTKPATEAKPAAENEAPAKAAPTPMEEKKQLAEQFKTQIEKAKAEITLAKRELEVSQRENQIRAAVFYADAGERQRNEKKYAEDDRKYQAEAADKKKAVAAAEAALEKLRDDARRAGVPPGMIP